MSTDNELGLGTLITIQKPNRKGVLVPMPYRYAVDEDERTLWLNLALFERLFGPPPPVWETMHFSLVSVAGMTSWVRCYRMTVEMLEALIARCANEPELPWIVARLIERMPSEEMARQRELLAALAPAHSISPVVEQTPTPKEPYQKRKRELRRERR